MDLKLTLNPLAELLKWEMHVNSFLDARPRRLVFDLEDFRHST